MKKGNRMQRFLQQKPDGGCNERTLNLDARFTAAVVYTPREPAVAKRQQFGVGEEKHTRARNKQAKAAAAANTASIINEYSKSLKRCSIAATVATSNRATLASYSL
jgi:hypothetical protein